MIVIIDNGLFAHVIKQNLKQLNQESIVISSQSMNLEYIESLKPDAIMISNGLERKEYINNSIKIAQRFAWRVPILSIGIGAIAVGILFNAKVTDTKISNLLPFEVNHDGKTVFEYLQDNIISTKWCKYAICDEVLSQTDLSITARHKGEIIGFRHKNLAIEGILFDITSLACDQGKDILRNFISFYL